MIEARKQNKKDIFAQAYEEFSDAIFRYCLYQTFNREKALDLTQETFVKTWEYLSSGKKVENLKAFLYKVAKNLIIDDRRKKKSESLDQLLEKGFNPKGKDETIIYENVFEARIAFKKVGKLDEKYREVIILRFVEDMEIKEIAKILKESENNISVKINRGLKKLKEILEEE